MQPFVRVCAVVVVASCVGCSDPAPTPPPPPRIERVDLVVASARADVRADMLRERSGVARLESDARDAWIVDVGGSLTVEWETTDPRNLYASIAPVVERGGPTSGRIDVEWRVSASPSSSFVTPLDLAAPAWSTGSLHEIRDAGRRLVIEPRWVGVPPPGADKVRVAFEAPRDARGLARPKRDAPNVLILTVDTLRPDRLGCYGYARPTSPHLDALAARGTRYAEAYSSAPWTLPSYGSLFTGLLPGEHRAGVVTERDALFGRDEDAPAKGTTEKLRADVTTLAERFAAAGYATAMLHNNPYLSRGSGIERGFQRYAMYGSNAKNGVSAAITWIANQRAPWFGVLHLMDPHFPYAPPAPFDRQFAGVDVETVADWPPDLDALRAGPPSVEIAQLSSGLYDGEIAFTDQEIGRLLGALETSGALANTIVVLHSDHGEEFWEHGSCDHGHAQLEELLRVPLVIAWPDRVPAGRVVEERVRALDLYATLLDLAGLEVPSGIESRSLRPTFTAQEAPRVALAEAIHRGKREIKAVLDGATKYVQRGADVQVHDLARDPRERTPIGVSDAARVDEIRAFLLAHRTRTREAAKRAEALRLDDAAQHRLEGIGYAGSDAAPREK